MTVDDLQRLSWVWALCANGANAGIRMGTGVSMREVASTLGVSVATVHRWESDAAKPTGARALAYALLLERLSPKRRTHVA